MEKTIERLVNGNIKVTIPIRLKYDGCKTVIHQPEVEQAELDPETMSPLQKAVIQGSHCAEKAAAEKAGKVLFRQRQMMRGKGKTFFSVKRPNVGFVNFLGGYKNSFHPQKI